ncbi:YczE/YyaS/YitT family protein [Vagococcus intermedius]|uniref:YitT family protein n=1 Tax=Vagococcus intermedius TaxID=2991418 RepID=A0AAF0I8I4_9ENTE|nr:hypothetical protein [Vagococcus intermedius]WEG72572.1 hypothetical protein OL234_06170 [Vagococcus intermedius]WEG74658.1 hypothetical protein OL235_06170 [Vagococcus intermedius]
MKLFNFDNITLKKLGVSLIGIFLVCIGVAFNNNTLFGNDPVGIVYDGLRSFLSLEQSQLGTVSNYMNIVLIIILFIFGKRYLNIGTLLYLIPYGLFISIGSHIYPLLFNNDVTFHRYLGGFIGISLYYIGISLFVASDIGVDPFNGIMLTIRDRASWSIRKSKIVMDIVLILVGVLLGGKFGVITILTALTTGPAIQFLSQYFEKYIYGKVTD